jgi:hypothetical protein
MALVNFNYFGPSKTHSSVVSKSEPRFQMDTQPVVKSVHEQRSKRNKSYYKLRSSKKEPQ